MCFTDCNCLWSIPKSWKCKKILLDIQFCKNRKLEEEIIHCVLSGRWKNQKPTAETFIDNLTLCRNTIYITVQRSFFLLFFCYRVVKIIIRRILSWSKQMSSKRRCKFITDLEHFRAPQIYYSHIKGLMTLLSWREKEKLWKNSKDG